jgi:hypothetical protein
MLELIGIGNQFLNRTLVAQKLKEKIDKMELHEAKNLQNKTHGHQIKYAAPDWEKIFASYISDNRLITGTNRELQKINSPKINDTMKKWPNELKKAYSKEVFQLAKTYMK